MIRLFVNWYLENNQPRGKELNRCIEHNYHSKFIDEVINLSDAPLPEGKIKNIPIVGRPTYNDFFKAINEVAMPSDISIIANLDIYFDESILLAKRMDEHDAYALTRWDVEGKNFVFLNRNDSQDVWVIKGKPKMVSADFGIGNPGCDNALAYRLKRAGYNVSNPSLSIKTYHVHNSGTRHYMDGNRPLYPAVPQPYLLLAPTKIYL